MRVQRAREMAAHESAIAAFEAIDAPDRLAIARDLAQLRARVRAAGRRPLRSAWRRPGEAWPEASIAWDALWSATRGMALSYRHPAESALLYRRAAAHRRARSAWCGWRSSR